MSTAISFPFTLSNLGVVESTDQISKIYVDRLLTLLSTHVGQRPMSQSYGTNLIRALYENDNDFPIAVEQAIRQAVSLWIPEITIQDIQITSPRAEGYSEVRITIELPNSLLTSLNVSTAVFNVDGSISSAME